MRPLQFPLPATEPAPSGEIELPESGAAPGAQSEQFTRLMTAAMRCSCPTHEPAASAHSPSSRGAHDLRDQPRSSVGQKARKDDVRHPPQTTQLTEDAIAPAIAAAWPSTPVATKPATVSGTTRSAGQVGRDSARSPVGCNPRALSGNDLLANGESLIQNESSASHKPALATTVPAAKGRTTSAFDGTAPVPPGIVTGRTPTASLVRALEPLKTEEERASDKPVPPTPNPGNLSAASDEAGQGTPIPKSLFPVLTAAEASADNMAAAEADDSPVPANGLPSLPDLRVERGKISSPGSKPDSLSKSSANPVPPSGATQPTSDPHTSGGDGGTQRGVAGNPLLTTLQPPNDADTSGHGISTAQQVSPMKMAEKLNESTGSTEQNLPVNPVSIAGEDLPDHNTRSFDVREHAERTEFSSLPVSSAGARASAPVQVSPAAISAAGRTNEIPAVVQRAAELVSQHALQLREAGAESLRVVVKPDAHLQISLDLHQGQDGIHVQATLHQGNFDLLNRHWQELQQQMEARGIRLANLATQDNAAHTGQQHSQQSRHEPRGEEAIRTGTSVGLAFAGALAAPEMKPAPAARRGWESWA